MAENNNNLMNKWRADLMSVLHYNDETGVFTWKKHRKNHMNEGDIAGTKNSNGYINIGFRGKVIRAHRLAWMFVYGSWPTKSIDHKNGNTSDNRIINLRECSHRENMMNMGDHKNNTSGFKGVSLRGDGKKWRACISLNGKQVTLGSYRKASQASAAYKLAEYLYFGQFAREVAIGKDNKE
ncbi:HNH endonuclease [Candidatus Symbiopectobacterium sp. NZEC135]|uniref:HNH endonuclease n=1 Tax=Candidatus Symbiopectobacterium sp. NZEC135 TaxID=2820471 RepID=UPI002226C5BB|nr:HNH endonuclease [Candidatus Symbiopectobacterium sp. NZEC135]MCW2477733.1 HNH endonuclease [Candidatus Symbiopectobacterium sp. NZEC135]